MIPPVTGRFISVVKNYLSRTGAIADLGIQKEHVEILKKTGEILEAHAVAENKISTDPRLTDEGKAGELVELARSTLKKLGFLPQRAVDMDTAKSRLEALLFAVPAAPKGANNEVIQYLREAEIRTRQWSLSESERIGRYIKILHQEESPETIEFIRAIRLAPGEPLIPEEVRRKAERERVERAKPGEWKKLQSMEEVSAVLEALADMILTWLRSYRFELPTRPPKITSGQYLVGHADEIKIPMLKDPVRA